VSSLSSWEKTGMGCQLNRLFHSMSVPFGGKKAARTVCMVMWVRGTPVAWAWTDCRREGRRRGWRLRRKRRSRTQETETEREEQRRNWVMSQARLSFAICKRPHYQAATPRTWWGEYGWSTQRETSCSCFAPRDDLSFIHEWNLLLAI